MNRVAMSSWSVPNAAWLVAGPVAVTFLILLITHVTTHGAGSAPLSSSDERIVIPLDFQYEVVLMPSPEAMRELQLLPARLEKLCRDALSSQRQWGKAEPTQIVFGGLDVGSTRAVRLIELATVSVRPITFVPEDDLQDLSARLTSNNKRVAEESLAELVKLRGRGKNIVPLLLPRLRQAREIDEVSSIFAALDLLGPYAARAIPVLEEQLKLKPNPESEQDENELNRVSAFKSRAADALARIGSLGLPTLERAMREEKDEWTRRYAARALLRIGDSGTSVLRTMLRDTDPGLRSAAAQALYYSKEKQNIPALLPLLNDSEAAVRREAAATLAEFGVAAREAVPALFAILDEPDSESKASALRALGRVGCDAKQLLPRLKEFLEAKREDPDAIHETALGAARELGREAAPLVPQIAACLDGDWRVAEAALEALEAIGGKEAAVAADRVASLAADADSQLSEVVLKALFTMGPNASAQAKRISVLLQDKRVDIQRVSLVVEVLGAMGVAARDTIPEIVPTLRGYGSVGFTPVEKVRAIAAIDLGEAIVVIEKDMIDRPVIGDGFRVQDRRRESLEMLDKIKVDAELVVAVTTVRRTTRLGQELDWARITRWSRVLRPGDSIERVVAALGMPELAGLGWLEYQQKPGEKVEGKPLVTLRVALEDGRFQAIELQESERK